MKSPNNDEIGEPVQTMFPNKARGNIRRIAEFLKIITGNKRTTFGFIVFVSLFVIGLLAPMISPWNPTAQNLTYAYQPPFWLSGGTLAHLLGTDSLGRDIFSRLLYGFGIATYVAIVSTFFVALIGTPIGLISGYFRGRLDGVLMRIVDMWMSIPPVLLSIALIFILGIASNNVVLAIILVDWTRFARVIRGEVLNVREKDFILAAQSAGFDSYRIITKEVFPNIIAVLTILATLEMSIAITVEVLLSFVGLGVPSGTPSWGAMIADGLSYMQVDLWPVFFPLLTLMIVITGLNLLGDGLREQMDPRLQVTR